MLSGSLASGSEAAFNSHKFTLMRTTLLITLLAILSFQSLAQRTLSDRRQVKRDWDGRSILTVQPIGFVLAYGRANPAAGLEYEYIVSKKLGMGIHIPIMFGFTGPDQAFGNDYQTSTFYTAPGVRFHVGGRGRERVDFATGPSIIIGNQHYKPRNNYGYNPYPTSLSAYNRAIAGIAADNVLNIQRGNFIFGFSSRVGYTFDRYNSSRYFMDLGMHFGGRF